ncbi:MAG: helix-turn-helix domain-containing protein [Mycoplasmatota bacterium]
MNYIKEIGEKLKDARESIGISKEEACEDLKLTNEQLENIEIGDIQNFKDILSVKFLIRDYAKYLGLNFEDVVDEFNEYLFDYTSKISLDEIKEAKKVLKIEEEVKISSPYTIEKKDNKYRNFYFIGALIVLVLGLIVACAFLILEDTNEEIDGGVVINIKN